MADPKSVDFQVVGRCLLYAALGTFLLPESSAIAAERIDRLLNGDTIQLAQSSASDSIANIQRLLTILADRYKRKFGAVDPGRVDGSYGAETKLAIRKYQEISGIKPGSQTNEQLVADILATLAAMSANSPEEETGSPRRQIAALPTPANKSASAKTAANPVATGKIARTPDTAGVAPAEAAKTPAAPMQPAAPARARPTYTAPVPPAKVMVPPAAEQVTKTVSQAPTKPNGDRVYFTQLASLRTLEAAQREWQRIFEANRAALNGEQVYFEEAEIAGRGTFHRILVGPIPERDAARTLCGFLKQNDQPCVVISRNLSTLRKLRDKDGKLAPAILPAPGRDSKVAETTPTDRATATATTPVETGPAKPGPASDVTAPAAPATATAASTPQPSTAGGANQSTSPANALPDEASVTASVDSASKVFPEKPASATRKSEAAKPVVVAVVPAPSIETAAVSAPSTPAPAPRGETTAIIVETLAVPAADAAPSATPPAKQETKTSTLVPFSQSPATAPASQNSAGDAKKSSDSVSPPAVSTAQKLSSPGIVDKILNYLGGMRNLIGIVVVLIFGAAALQYIWWRRNRRGAFAQIFRPSNYSFGQPASTEAGQADALSTLETDFDSEQLRESRSIRDEFLRDILGEDLDLDDATEKKDPAIRINSSLKSLLVSDPAQYKSIFLNWIFLSRVGAALNQHEITMEELNGHFGREFSLLQNYFKIHLLELDDRHRIRKELPGLFYCLQIAQQRQRHAAGAA